MNHEILNNTEYLFSIALKKTGNLTEAEDLTQEVLLAALSYLKRGGVIANMHAWLSATLNHKWNDILRKKYKLPTISIDVVADELEEETIADGPNAEQVRREVAYLAKLQRDVIIKHYLLGEKVQTIADELGIPKGTVLSRLSSGREQMRKGLENMEQYEKQSYIPERLELSCHGGPGLHDEPWSLVADDLMKQNILIIAYEKPVTVVEIAKALGIPTPYIEKAVEALVSAQLMCQMGNKVFTDFLVTTPEMMLTSLDEQIALAEQNYESIWSCLNGLHNEIKTLAWFTKLKEREKVILEYYAMLDVFSRGIFAATGRIVEVKEEYPNRPDGGRWIAQGSRYPADFDFDSYPFAKYCYGGERRAYWEKFLGSQSIELHVYDTQPDLNKYENGPVEIHDDNLCKLLYMIHQGISFDDTGFDLMFLEDIPHLAECGVLRYENDKLKVAIPVISKIQYGELRQVIAKYINQLADVLEGTLCEVLPKLKLPIPQHLEGRVAEFRKYTCYALPMAIMKKAISEGDFLQNIDYPTPPMVLVIEQ